MRIGIIGAGSIGLLLASYLGEEHEISLIIRRKEQRTLIKERGIELYHQSTYYSHVKPNVVDDVSKEFMDCYFVCVKQTALPQIKPLLDRIPTTRPVIFIQNGMGHLSFLNALRQQAYIGIVEHGAKRMSDYQINHLGKGKITLATLGEGEQSLKDIVQQLNQPAFPFQLTLHYMELMKEKLIVNSVINPLTALFEVENGEVLNNESIFTMARKITREVANTLDIQVEEAWSKVEKVAQKTAHNTSSMLQDIQAGQETEIKSILGYVLEEAEEELAYTTFLYHAILAKERKD